MLPQRCHAQRQRRVWPQTEGVLLLFSFALFSPFSHPCSYYRRFATEGFVLSRVRRGSCEVLHMSSEQHFWSKPLLRHRRRCGLNNYPRCHVPTPFCRPFLQTVILLSPVPKHVARQDYITISTINWCEAKRASPPGTDKTCSFP
jgi:hypothetical protein